VGYSSLLADRDYYLQSRCIACEISVSDKLQHCLRSIRQGSIVDDSTIWKAAKTTHGFESREGDLTLRCHGKTLRACQGLGFNQGKLSMPIVRSVTMLSLAREALERCDNDASAARAYLSERLLNDEQLREALVKSAIEYEKLEMMEAKS
jgi:hypothetical protein